MKKITALKVQQRNKNRVNIFLEGEFAFGLSRMAAGWLQIGQSLSEEKIKELKAKDEVEIALQRALNFLSYRARSEDEVRRNLIKHETPETAIEEIIERLQRGNLVNDKEFAELWVENRSEFRPRGRRALWAELKRKGLQPALIEHALKDLDETQLARSAADKQARKYKNLEWQEFRKKMSGFLARRGFNYGIISQILPQVWESFSEDSDNYHENEVRQ